MAQLPSHASQPRQMKDKIGHGKQDVESLRCSQVVKATTGLMWRLRCKVRAVALCNSFHERLLPSTRPLRFGYFLFFNIEMRTKGLRAMTSG